MKNKWDLMLLFTFLCCSYLANSLTLWKRHSFSLNCFPPHQSKSIQYLCKTKLLGIEANSLFFSIILTINLLHTGKKNSHCWFTIFSVPQLKSETGLHTRRARKDWRKTQPLQIGRRQAQQERELNMSLGLSPYKTSRYLHHARLKSLYDGLNGVQTCIQSRWSQ